MEQPPRRKRRLWEDGKLRCPRCKQLQDILAYVPFVQVPEFAADTVQVFKCTTCKWIFALKPDSVPKAELVAQDGGSAATDREEGVAA